MVQRAHRHRVRLFEELIREKDIQEALNIPKVDGTIYSRIKVLNVTSDIIKIQIKYVEKENFSYFSNIPIDLSRVINSYLCNNVVLEISMVIKENYPFTPIIWVLEKLSTTYNYKHVAKYYSNKIIHYNKRLQDDWLLVNMLDKEILCLYVMLGNFKLLTDHIYQ